MDRQKKIAHVECFGGTQPIGLTSKVTAYRKTALRGIRMSKNHKQSKLFDLLKACYRPSENDDKETAPFYVTSTGALYANANELIHAQVVQKQLTAFASLDNEINRVQKKQKVEQPQ